MQLPRAPSRTVRPRAPPPLPRMSAPSPRSAGGPDRHPLAAANVGRPDTSSKPQKTATPRGRHPPGFVTGVQPCGAPRRASRGRGARRRLYRARRCTWARCVLPPPHASPRSTDCPAASPHPICRAPFAIARVVWTRRGTVTRVIAAQFIQAVGLAGARPAGCNLPRESSDFGRSCATQRSRQEARLPVPASPQARPRHGTAVPHQP